MAKLSIPQKHILKLMDSGWELGHSCRFKTCSIMHSRFWLQEGGVGKGGKSMNVQYRTVQLLMDKGYLGPMGSASKGTITRTSKSII